MATETIYALFQTVSDAERAIGALIDHGIDRGNIGVVARRAAEQDESVRVRGAYERVVQPDAAGIGEPVVSYEQKPTVTPPAAYGDTLDPVNGEDTPANVESVGKEGVTTTTAADAGVGAAIGSGFGLLAGILASAAALTIPGFGLVLAGGAFAAGVGATLATGAAGAIAGGVAGYLRDMGMNEAAAASYAERINEGDYLISVTADTSGYDEVRRLLYKYNAVSVDLDIDQADRGPERVWEEGQPTAASLAGSEATAPNTVTAPPIAQDSWTGLQTDETVDPVTGRVDLAGDPLPDYPVTEPRKIGEPTYKIGPNYAPHDGASIEDLPQEIAPPTPVGRLGSPAPVRRIVTEEPDGTPIIPAREIEEVPPSAWRDPAVDVARAETAIDHDAEVDEAVQHYD